MNIAKIFVACGAAAMMVGCTPQGREAFHEADQSQSAAAEKMVDAAKTDAHATGKALKADAAKSQVSLNQDATTMKVRTSLGSSSKVDTSNITISHDGYTVILSGSVPTEEQKSQADQIANGVIGKDYMLKDQLGIKSK
jgi:osmotically-inducible protein OsmY